MTDKTRDPEHGLLDRILGHDSRHPLRVDLHVTVTAKGLEESLQHVANGLHAIARAIGHLVPPPPHRIQITAGTMYLDPQHSGDSQMANIINSLPQHITVVWTGVDATGSVVPVVPDTVDYAMSDSSLGTLVPDSSNPTGGATFTPNPGARGDITFSAVSHQAGMADFNATSVTGTLVDAVVPPTGVQITGGAMTLDPQLPPAAAARAIAHAAAMRRR